MSTKNYRKITVGDDFSNCIAYVKGANYLGRTITITDIVPSETVGSLDIYVEYTEKKDPGKILWKTIPESKIIETEYDLYFE